METVQRIHLREVAGTGHARHESSGRGHEDQGDNNLHEHLSKVGFWICRVRGGKGQIPGFGNLNTGLEPWISNQSRCAVCMGPVLQILVLDL